MKKVAFQCLLLMLLVLGFTTAQAWAQKPIKGNWSLTIQTPMGGIPVPFTFKKAGKGVVTAPSGTALPLSYQEKDANISISFEGPGLNPLDGSDITIIVRGTKTDSTITATGIIISLTADPSSPLGFGVLTTPIAGERQ